MIPASMQAHRRPFQHYAARHFDWACSEDVRVATITLNRPDKKNPLTLESYAELRDLFRDLTYASDVRSVVITGEGGNFCSGGDVFEIIEPLTRMPMPELFLFTRVGLAGADMGACGLLPRMIGQGRANELLMTGRVMTAQEGHHWGFFNALHESADVLAQAHTLAHSLADGPWFAHGMTKTMINQEWAMGIEEMIESEAQAQAICMMTQDFKRAFDAFAAKQKPRFEGN